jgi:hypothetical protein
MPFLFCQTDSLQSKLIGLKGNLQAFHGRHALPDQNLLPVIDAETPAQLVN